MRILAPSTLAAVAGAAMLVAGCQFASPPPEDEGSRLMRACAETERLLGQMKGAEPSFSYDDEGNARISRELWGSIPGAMQEGLIKAIAYRAVCATETPGEQVVTVRSSDTSEILAQQTVTEFDR